MICYIAVAVGLSLMGVVLVALADGGGSSGRHDSIIGNSLSLFSSLMYACYIVLLKLAVQDESRVNMSLFFGFVGISNMVFLWPLMFVLDWTGLEDMGLPGDAATWLFLMINALVGTVLSDYIWLLSVLYTTPLISTIGLSLSTPVAMVSDYLLFDKTFSDMYLAGSGLVVLGFLAINLADTADKQCSGSCDLFCSCIATRCCHSEGEEDLLAEGKGRGRGLTLEVGKAEDEDEDEGEAGYGNGVLNAMNSLHGHHSHSHHHPRHPHHDHHSDHHSDHPHHHASQRHLLPNQHHTQPRNPNSSGRQGQGQHGKQMAGDDLYSEYKHKYSDCSSDSDGDVRVSVGVGLFSGDDREQVGCTGTGAAAGRAASAGMNLRSLQLQLPGSLGGDSDLMEALELASDGGSNQHPPQ